MFTRPINIGLSPNTSIDDFLTAFNIIIKPWKWQLGEEIGKVEEWFRQYFRVNYAVSFNAGRSALFAILQQLEIGNEDEVMLQAFTCVALPNSILWCGAKPIYIDIDKTLNIDIDDAEKKLTSKTKALIVQHTFGIAANLEKISAFCKKHQLYLIEDCAHSLGTRYKNKLVGTFGDAAFFSFGRDKIISSVFGGLVITNNKNLGNKIIQYQKNLQLNSYFWIFQQLIHPILSTVVLPLYNFFNLGKVILWLSQKLTILSFPLYNQEKQGKRPSYFPRKFPNSLAFLALNQLNKLDQLNQRRKITAQFYFSKLKNTSIQLPAKDISATYLRFNILTTRRDEFKFKAKQKGIILGNWYHNIIDPKGVNKERLGYRGGYCPKAEKAARESLNLPTYPSVTNKQLNKICQLLLK